MLVIISVQGWGGGGERGKGGDNLVSNVHYGIKNRI